MTKDCPCCDGSGELGPDHHAYTKEDLQNKKGPSKEANKLVSKVAEHFMERKEK